MQVSMIEHKSWFSLDQCQQLSSLLLLPKYCDELFQSYRHCQLALEHQQEVGVDDENLVSLLVSVKNLQNALNVVVQ